MKVAILISGYLRSFKVNLPMFKTKILDKFKKVDVFIHITKDEKTEDRYFNQIDEFEEISNISRFLNPKSIVYEPNTDFHDSKNNSLLNNWIKYYKLNQIKKIHEEINGLYDIVIKFRPDMNLVSDVDFYELKSNRIFIPHNSFIDKDKLCNPDDNYICDIFAFGPSELMNTYFDFYTEIIGLIPKHGSTSETLLYEFLKIKKVPYEIINLDYNMILSQCNVFAIAGDSGSGKTTLGNILKKYFSKSFMLECDRYHKWERGDENWKKFTHLNPSANFITKMNDDIFNLKIGKSIYQVDYDHTNGKFTESEKIDSSDNLIVCGLHSLYYENSHIYNLKIFMDTSTNLKIFWKLKRDSQKRGYTINEVLDQIDKRKEDYYAYIYPQRQNSDLIINFFSESEFNIFNTDFQPDVSLRIFVNKKFTLVNILSIFCESDVDFKLENKDEVFNQITFLEYKKLKNFDNLNSNNFYDYILVFILNLKN